MTYATGLFQGKRALVTGATQGIGAVIANHLAALGAEVTALGLGQGDGTLAAGIAVAQADVTSAAQVDEAIAAHDRLDIVFNCAGIIQRGAEHDLEVFERVLAVNLTGTMRVCSAARERLRASRGCIVNTASMLSFFGGGLVPGYAASKGGIAQLTKSLAIAYASDGIRVNAVAPGWIATPLTQALQDDPDPRRPHPRAHAAGPLGHAGRRGPCGGVPLHAGGGVHDRRGAAGGRRLHGGLNGRTSRAADNPRMTAARSMTAPGARPPARTQVAGTAAFSKFMHVMQLVADAEAAPNVTALMHASGYPRPTVHRIVAALLAEGLLVESPGSATLVLGPRLIQLASRSWSGSALRLAAVDELKRLRDLTGETVHLAVPSGRAMVYIEKLESPSAVRMASRIGSSVALYSTAVGKAYLAALDDAAFGALVRGLPMPRHTPHTVTALPALRAQVRQVRARGWSVDEEENEAGIHCYGAAICGAGGEPVAAVSVSTLVFRRQDDPERAYVAPLLAACRAISARLAQTPALRQGDAA